MPTSKLRCFSLIFCAASALCPLSDSQGYELVERWIDTASGAVGSTGSPATITWSIVPDQTSMLGLDGSFLGGSDLVSKLDTLLGYGNGSDDLSQRPWFPYVESAFQRWSELGGATFVYEPNDDGAVVGPANVNSPPGILGTRGDVRVGGFEFNVGAVVNGYGYLPPGGDIGLNTEEDSLFTNSSNNHSALRRVVMHELGHGLGFGHIWSDDSDFLLERIENGSFDGPQIDEIRGLHRAYGDRFEKTNDAAGNDRAADATPLGQLIDSETIRVGTDAGELTLVEFHQSDFVSIDGISDFDYYSITTTSAAVLDVRLTPRGPTYLEAAYGQPQAPIFSDAVSDLTLAVFDTDGITRLVLENATGFGGAEFVQGLELETPGQYFIRVLGNQDEVQLYDLSVTATYVPEPSGYCWVVLVWIALVKRMKAFERQAA